MGACRDAGTGGSQIESRSVFETGGWGGLCLERRRPGRQPAQSSWGVHRWLACMQSCWWVGACMKADLQQHVMYTLHLAEANTCGPSSPLPHATPTETHTCTSRPALSSALLIPLPPCRPSVRPLCVLLRAGPKLPVLSRMPATCSCWSRALHWRSGRRAFDRASRRWRLHSGGLMGWLAGGRGDRIAAEGEARLQEHGSAE